MNSDQPPIGFIGIGSMGWPMAARLAAAGYRLVVQDADPARARRFADAHAAEAAVTPDSFSACAIVITMLPTSVIVEEVLCAPAGIARSLRPGALVLEMSSGNPADTVRIAAALGERGVRLADAPVSGGVKRAEAGELAIMAGGDAASLDEAQPVLAAMGTTLLRTGEAGSAHAMKALNNLVSATGFVAGIEALLIGKQFGLEPAVMVDVLNQSTGMNNSTQKKFKQFVLSGSFDSGFGLDLMLKDLGIALDLAARTRTTAPLSTLCRELWQAGQHLLGPGRDHTEIARMSGLLAGTQLAREPDGGRSPAQVPQVLEYRFGQCTDPVAVGAGRGIVLRQ